MLRPIRGAATRPNLNGKRSAMRAAHHQRSRCPCRASPLPGPATVDAEGDRASPITRFNSALAVAITKGVGSMWCAYAFAVLALCGLPGAIFAGMSSVVQWIAQTFLQLVLLSIVVVGQNVQVTASDKQTVDTFAAAKAIQTELAQIRAHLLEQTRPCAGSRTDPEVAVGGVADRDGDHRARREADDDKGVDVADL